MKPINNVCLSESEMSLLLSGDLPPDETVTTEQHIAECVTCRSEIESMIADSRWWDDARHSLAASATHVAASLRDAVGINADAASLGETRLRENVLNLLGPTDDPNMLGRIGQYEITGLLGQGGMGAVFKGFDRSLNRFVAIKMLLPHLAASGAARKRFAREGQAVAAVVDDHVMAIHCVDEWQGVPYLVMTYSRGVSLQKRLSDNGPLEVREILRIGMQAAKGLAAAHAQGIVHRDIKPANIFLDQNVERVQLMDFGLARAVDDASLTRSGTLAGTPQYMSPEQARAETIDYRSDLFSLGSVLYAVCTGHAPFRAESSYSVLRLITDKEPRPIREINPDVPEWLCAIISKLMAKQANDRFASAQEVATLLEDCLAHVQQPTAVPLPPSLVPQTANHRSIFNVSRKGMSTMLGTLGMILLGMVLWQATEAPDISGQWTSDEWGTVVLEAKEPGHYEGTFTGTDTEKLAYEISDVPVVSSEGFGNQAVLTETKSGNIQLKWSRVERRFNGTWRKGINRNGKLSLRLIENDIRGARTTSKSDQKESDGPRLADLRWTRGIGPVEAESINSSEWEMQQVFNPAHDQMVWAVAFNPDGKTIASAGADNRIKFWDVASGFLRSTFYRPVNCTDVAFSPDGAYLAIAGGDHGENPPGELVLLETANGEEEFVLETHESAKYSKSVAFSPDSKWLASGGIDTAVKIWNVEQRELHAISTGHTELVSQVAFSPNGKLLASASFDHTVKLWSVPDGDAIATLRGHEKEVRGIAFSPDSQLLVSVGEDGTARVWNTRSGEQLGVMNGHGERFFSVAFAPDGQHVATGSRGPSGVMIWDVNTQKSISPVVLPQQEQEIMSLKFSSDGQMLAIVGSWNGFQIWKRKVAAN